MDISRFRKAGPGSEEASGRKKKSQEGGLVGLVNIGNSCYMNSTLQALSNCPPFRHYFTDCYLPSTSRNASDVVATLFKKMWTSERHPGHLSPRPMSSAMTNKMFKGSLQQDAQEFLRCLLTQLHDEIAVRVSDRDCGCGLKSCDSCCQRNSIASCVSHDSDSSNDSQSKLVATPSRHSPLPRKTSTLSISSSRRSSPSSTPKFSLKTKPSYGKMVAGSSVKSSTESLDHDPLDPGAVYLADLTTHTVKVHKEPVVDSGVASEASLAAPPPNQPARKRVVYRKSSIVSEVFEGILESRVKCSACKKVSVTREPFQDLSLPIPGRKEVAKYKVEKKPLEEKEQPKSTLNRGFCSVWSFVTALTRDILVGPPTDIGDCLNAFFDASELKGDNKYYCSNCKSFQNSSKEMSIVKLPEVLCIHFKRFRFDTHFSGKISRHIAFPLAGLDMSPYLKQGSPTRHPQYELNAIITHYGGAGGGHYVAFAKNVPRNAWYEFNDTHVHSVSADAVVGAEGYVLFYRRVPPSTSLAAQPLEIQSLIPRAGLASPDVCYISRHWLHLLKHFSHPGPITQHHFACRHGGVLPGVSLEEAKDAALGIRQEVWESLQQQYGGGPLVPRLEPCSSCREHLKTLMERRKHEKETVQKLNSRSSVRRPEPYLLSLAWLHQWQEFIKCITFEVEPPPPIDNTPLISNGRLGEDSLFRRLSPAIWKFLHDAYSGGPAIVTSIEDCQSSEQS